MTASDRPVLRIGGTRVQDDLVEPASLPLDPLDVLLPAQGVELGRGQLLHHVDVALAQRLHRGVAVLELHELQSGDFRGAAPEPRVGFEGDVPLRLVLGQHERPAADHRHLVVGERGDVVDL